MSGQPSLTKPVLRALRILCSEGRVRVSNVTQERGPRVSANGPRREPSVYWQSWRRLEDLGYAHVEMALPQLRGHEHEGGTGTNCYVNPTPAGRRRLALEGGDAT